MCRRLLCYGDSNTYGYDPRSYLGGRYPQSVRWTALLDAEGWKVINAGENGRSIPRQEQEIKMAVQMICHTEADALVVMLGSNDLLQCPGLAAEVCGERMERFLSTLLPFHTSVGIATDNGESYQNGHIFFETADLLLIPFSL